MIKVAPQKLIDWINAQMDSRGWSLRETARRAGISHTPLSFVLNGEKPSFETCMALANVFGVEPLYVLDLADLVSIPNEMSPSRLEWAKAFSELSPEDQEEMLAIARMKLAKKHKADSRSSEQPRTDGVGA